MCSSPGAEATADHTWLLLSLSCVLLAQLCIHPESQEVHGSELPPTLAAVQAAGAGESQGKGSFSRLIVSIQAAGAGTCDSTLRSDLWSSGSIILSSVRLPVCGITKTPQLAAHNQVSSRLG